MYKLTDEDFADIRAELSAELIASEQEVERLNGEVSSLEEQEHELRESLKEEREKLAVYAHEVGVSKGKLMTIRLLLQNQEQFPRCAGFFCAGTPWELLETIRRIIDDETEVPS